MRFHLLAVTLALAAVLASSGCMHGTGVRGELPDYFGTAEPMAADAVYFVVTDRFVNGDSSNDHRDQGGAQRTFDIPLPACDGVVDNIGYQGGDFRGVADNAAYIREMGFGAVWITPIVDNPDAAFTGGSEISCTSVLTDRGKSGYHGYWGVNFYEIDEHLPSPGLDFAGFTRAMHAQRLKVVLDIVGNHGTPAYTMPQAQPEFGKLYGKDGSLLADHQNLPPAKLDPANNPLHAFYNAKPGLAELSDFSESNPAVLDYLAGAYLQWIDQGADAFRIDTIPWMPHAFWKALTDRIRAERPGFFMFAEAFDYDAAKIAAHTRPENGGVSVLDFPLKQGIDEVFGRKRVGFERLREPLYLEGGPYANPYELMTFYDNHDMARMDADDSGFIDAHNWLFTARGIPVIYYGSETGFMRGRAEHAGNRNYFGQQRVDAAPEHAIHRNLKRIAQVRARSPALQRGLQVTLQLDGDRAAFYRVHQHGGQGQVVLVLLNKGDAPARFEVDELLQAGAWRSAIDGRTMVIADGGTLAAEVSAHGVEVFVLHAVVSHPGLIARLERAVAGARSDN